jgi:hypothetical protein
MTGWVAEPQMPPMVENWLLEPPLGATLQPPPGDSGQQTPPADGPTA